VVLLYKPGIPAAVVVAVTVRLSKWNILTYRSWLEYLYMAFHFQGDLELIEFDLISAKGRNL
jgi:hypothetical protein